MFFTHKYKNINIVYYKMNKNDSNDNEENKEELYNLNNHTNYKSQMTDDINIIYISYVRIIHNFILHSLENMNNINKSFFLKGLDMMGHIFIMLYTYTKHLELTAFHCRNAIVHYVEYISQITDKDDNMFFNLSLKDAIIYVYTKTIYSISETTRQNIHFFERENKLIKNLHKNILLYAEIIRKISASEDFNNATTNEKEGWFKNIQDELLGYIERRFSNIKTRNEYIDVDTLLSSELNVGFTGYNKYLNNTIFKSDRDFLKLNEIIRLME